MIHELEYQNFEIDIPIEENDIEIIKTSTKFFVKRTLGTDFDPFSLTCLLDYEK